MKCGQCDAERAGERRPRVFGVAGDVELGVVGIARGDQHPLVAIEHESGGEAVLSGEQDGQLLQSNAFRDHVGGPTRRSRTGGRH